VLGKGQRNLIVVAPARERRDIESSHDGARFRTGKWRCELTRSEPDTPSRLPQSARGRRRLSCSSRDARIGSMNPRLPVSWLLRGTIQSKWRR
jgi:hypothetical protein